MPDLTTIDRRVRLARVAGWSTAAAVYLIALLTLASLRAGPSNSTARDLLVLLAQWALPSGPLVGYLVYARLVPSGGLIVWLRRFGPRRWTRFNFAAVLGRASVGLGHPLTLQDASVPASLMAAGVRLSMLAVWFGMFVVWLLGLVLVSSVLEVLRIGSGAAVVVAVLLSTAVTGVLVQRTLRRLGFRALSDDEARAVAEVRARSAAAREGRRRIGIGVEVVRCPRTVNGEQGDRLWHAVVRTALQAASVAVVDVTDLNENVRWELATALNTLGRERVMLTLPAGVATEDQVWAQVCEPIQRESGRRLDRPWLRGALHPYPTDLPLVGPSARRTIEDVTRRMRAALGERVTRAAVPTVRT